LNLEPFIENMNTECGMIGNPIIPIKAIKIDGNGSDSLKYKLCENSLKSCDYIKFTDNDICFIEFSDYYEQLKYLKNISTSVSNSNIAEDDLKTLMKNKVLIKEPNVIKNELQSKISETLLLFQVMVEECAISEHLNKNKIFIISLCKIIVSDIIVFDRLLRELQKKFKLIIDIELFIYLDVESFITKKTTLNTEV